MGKRINILDSTQRVVVIVYNGKEMSPIGEKLIADYLFDNAAASNISFHRLDVRDIAKLAAASGLEVHNEAIKPTEKSPLQHALTYIGETVDLSSSLSDFIIHILNRVRTEENDPEKKLTKALAIISSYDNPEYRDKVPEYKKYGFKHGHIDAIRNIYKHFE